MVLNCLIADDEPLAHQLLENYIGRLKSLQVVGHAFHAMEALDFLNDRHVDILFLDIQMPDFSGLDMLRTLPNPPAVILTTAYSEYSLEAFDLGVTDYLLKPIKFERFLKAVNRAIAVQKGRATPPLPSEPTAGRSGPLPGDTMFVKDGVGEYKIRLEDILYVQAYGNFVKIHRQDQALIVATITMKEMEESLPAVDFVRVHKSFIVPLRRITRLEGNQVFIGAQGIPLGTVYKLTVTRRIKRPPLTPLPD
jgi:DNA-binding LytR/AlgR family response regulator